MILVKKIYYKIYILSINPAANTDITEFFNIPHGLDLRFLCGNVTMTKKEVL